MESNDLSDLLKSGYEAHAHELQAGDEFAAKHHDRVAHIVRRRRIVRQGAMAGGAFASVSALAIAGIAVSQVARGGISNPLAESASPTAASLASASVTPTPVPSFSASPTPEATDEWPSWAPPLPTGDPEGAVVEDSTLRLLLDAQAPASAEAAPTSVACGAPAGEYVAPFFVDATARILRPDTIYPTYLGPSYVPQPDDGLLALGLTDSYPAGQFFVALSTAEHEGARAWEYDESTGWWSGGTSADYTSIAHGGALDADSVASMDVTDIDFLYGAVVVQNGVIVGHADLWSLDAEGTALSGAGEVGARDADTEIVYDFGVGPLANILWCNGGAPTGPVDTYAVVATRSFDVETFDYTLVWAGAVEYK